MADLQVGEREPGSRSRLALSSAAAVGTLYGVQGIAPTLPAVQAQLGLDASALGLLTAAYMLPAVLFSVPFGYLADTWGRRKVFTLTTVLWSLAGLAQAWAGSLWLLLLLRFVQGVGFAALMPMSITLIGDAVRGQTRVRAQASRQIQMTVGELVTPLIGAALALLSWRAPLAAQGALLPMAAVAWWTLDDRRYATTSLRGYADSLVTAVRLDGMAPLMLAGFLRFWCKFAGLAYVPFVLIDSLGASTFQAALVTSFASLVAAVTSSQTLRVLRVRPASQVLIGSVVISCVGTVLYGLLPSWQLAFVVSLVYGIGDGLLTVVQNALIVEAAPATVRAGVIAANATIRNAGKLVGPAVVGALILVMSPAWALVVMGGVASLVVPTLRQVRRLDPLLASPGKPEVPES